MNFNVDKGVCIDERKENAHRLDAIMEWWMKKVAAGELTKITDYEQYNAIRSN